MKRLENQDLYVPFVMRPDTNYTLPSEIAGEKYLSNIKSLANNLLTKIILKKFSDSMK